MEYSRDSLSFVNYYGKHSDYSCGYCKGSRNVSHGMSAYELTVQTYQDLIDRGWRRSGTYCYKPAMAETCCPSYTIKCDVRKFKLTKSHKKILKRMNKFLLDGNKKDDRPVGDKCELGGESHLDIPMDVQKCSENSAKRDDLNSLVVTKIDSEILNNTARNPSKSNELVSKPIAACPAPAPVQSEEPNTEAQSSAVCSNPLRKKAKLMRIERKREKLAKQGLTMQKKEVKNCEKSLDDFLNEQPKNGAHRLQTRLIRPNGPEFRNYIDIEFELFKKYQITIHNDPPETEDTFTTFLVETPLKDIEAAEKSQPVSLGSFHQQYWLDDKLIAVGVIDVLPKCISSVYFFYDPDYAFLSLGTYGSLCEISFTKKLCQLNPEICNYYMGYYIHSCPKMRYKGKLYPSYLLCPEVYTWHLIDDALLARLDAKKYQRLEPDPTKVDHNKPSSIAELKNIFVLYRRNFMQLRQYLQMVGDDKNEEMLEYATLVGMDAIRMMVKLE